MRRLCHGSLPTPSTRRKRAGFRRWGRGSEVFFAGVPGPASQLPRFSVPFPPGTRPHHRRVHAVLLTMTLASGHGDVKGIAIGPAIT